MPVVYACIQPSVGNAAPDAPKTSAAVATVMRDLAAYQPEVVVVIHAPSSPREAIGLSGDTELRGRVAAEAKKDAIPIDAPRRTIDDALAQQLRDGIDAQAWLWITTARLGLRYHFELGRALARAVQDDARPIAIVCLAELSHTDDVRTAQMFDEHYRRAIEDIDVRWLVHADAELRRRAGESAVAQTVVLFGALGAYRIQPRVLSYETVEGRGLVVAAIDVLGPRKGAKS
jgi:hypothetical protein